MEPVFWDRARWRCISLWIFVVQVHIASGFVGCLPVCTTRLVQQKFSSLRLCFSVQLCFPQLLSDVLFSIVLLLCMFSDAQWTDASAVCFVFCPDGVFSKCTQVPSVWWIVWRGHQVGTDCNSDTASWILLPTSGKSCQKQKTALSRIVPCEYRNCGRMKERPFCLRYQVVTVCTWMCEFLSKQTHLVAEWWRECCGHAQPPRQHVFSRLLRSAALAAGTPKWVPEFCYTIAAVELRKNCKNSDVQAKWKFTSA